MKMLAFSRVGLLGMDSQGPYLMTEVDGEWVGVSLAGEDECLRHLDLPDGTLVEAGNEVYELRATSNAVQSHDAVDAYREAIK